MDWYILVALGSLAICLVSCLFHFMRLVKKGKPVDYAVPAGDTTKAVMYSFTGAMSPAKKESAYLHLPVYAAGILYHLGTFLSILLFFLFIAGVWIEGVMSVLISVFLALTTLSGLWILIRRALDKTLRTLSNPDDYLSNILVTLFQAATIGILYYEHLVATYFITASALLLYLPLGKLRHAVYFFAARYHLGYFFGYRGTWPPVK
jgi:nitrate reductase gamma subunit